MHVGDIDVMIDVYIYILSVTMECKKNYNSRGLCRVPWTRHSAKFFPKKIQKFFAECLGWRTRQSIFFKKNFAECLGRGTRQSIKKKKLCRVPGQRHSAKDFFLKIQKFFAECLGWGTRQSNFLKKKNLPSAWTGALGKVIF